MVFIKLPSSLSSSSPHSSSLALRTPSARTASPEYPFYQKNWFIGLLFLMAHGFFCLALLIFLTVDSDSGYTSASAAASGKEGVESVFRLHSSDVPYGSGSGQQSVTGFPVVLDSNSYWIVKHVPGTTAKQGDAVKSGATIRLQHMKTKKWLHSHLHASPISGNLEKYHCSIFQGLFGSILSKTISQIGSARTRIGSVVLFVYFSRGVRSW